MESKSERRSRSMRSVRMRSVRMRSVRMRSVRMRSVRMANFFSMTWLDALIAVTVLLLTCLISILFKSIDEQGDYVSMMFILAVFLIARFTKGYVCGIVSSLVGVLLVNYIFTFPYFKFNFTMAGYPLTILCMLGVSIATSTLTSRAKENERIRIEAEKEKTRSNLLRAVSHDLRTPLTSITGVISLILDEGDALPLPQRTELLKNAQSDAQWLIRMVENLLTVTRMDESTHGGIIKTDEAVEDLISGAVTKFRKRFPDITLTADIPETYLMIPADAVLIEQVLLNLFENAVIHGKTTDRIALRVTRAGNRAVFTVRDNGAGIDQAKLGDLFNGKLMSAGEQEGDRSRRNMGIGLSVCSTIIRAHGGAMCAYNLPEGGAGFEFYLMLTDTPQENITDSEE